MNIELAIEIAEKLLPDAKLWIRKTSASLDAEVKQTTAACLLDLKNVGVVNVKVNDPLIQQAAKLYLKAQLGYDDKSEKWEAAYEHLKAALSLCSDYTEAVEEVTPDG